VAALYQIRSWALRKVIYNRFMRRHRTDTDRNMLLGFFALLFIVGGGLIWLFYGGGAAAFGLACIAAGAMLTGLVLLIMFGLQWLSDWLEKRDLG
jgi:hypothetical protein